MNSVKITKDTHYEKTCDIQVVDGEVVFYSVSEIPCEMVAVRGNQFIKTSQHLQEVTCQTCLNVINE